MANSKDKPALRLLLTGDLHLGRSSSRLSNTALHDEFRATTAWHRIVDLAIREQVHVLCLSGDVVDETNRFWETIGPLEQGIRRLAEQHPHSRSERQSRLRSTGPIGRPTAA